jgi:transposase-like protein
MAKAGKRPTFTPEQKNDAVAYHKSGHTLNETAEYFGCSVASIQEWKKQYSGKSKQKAAAPADEWEEQAEPASTPVKSHGKPDSSFEKFAHKFWEKRAADVVLMDSSKREELVNMTNDALRFSYEQTQKNG